MIATQAQQLLDAFLSCLLSDIEFQRTKDLRYEKSWNDATALLLFPYRLSTKGCAMFSVRVGLRFDAISEWIDYDDVQTQPTFATPIHLLRDNDPYTEWEYSSSQDLDRLKDLVLADIEAHAIPFIERYSKLAILRATLECQEPRKWVSLGINVDRREVIMAAIQLIEGDRSGALRALDNALVERNTALPKRRFQIEYLRKRIMAGGIA